MCGIAGFIGMEQTEDDVAQLIDRMCRVIHHRGPDNQGVWSSAHVVLGMRRLAIIDVTGGAAANFQ